MSRRWPAIRSTMCRACPASASRPAPSSSPNMAISKTLLARAAEIKQPKRRENLIQFAEQARLSKQLVTLERRCAGRGAARAVRGRCARRRRDSSAFCKTMEFTTLMRRVAADLGGRYRGDRRRPGRDQSLAAGRREAAAGAARPRRRSRAGAAEPDVFGRRMTPDEARRADPSAPCGLRPCTTTRR